MSLFLKKNKMRWLSKKEVHFIVLLLMIVVNSVYGETNKTLTLSKTSRRHVMSIFENQ